MLDDERMVSYLRMALALKDPSTETDPAFRFTDDELLDILGLVTPVHNPEYTLETLPENEKYFAMLLARKEIYFRLATASAPFYPIKAEGAELRKDVRFSHYMTLVNQVNTEYDIAWEQFDTNRTIEYGDVLLLSKHFTSGNYEKATKPTVALTINNVGHETVEISWTKFLVPSGMFSSYDIYVSTLPIYDEYMEELSDRATKVISLTDIHRLKYRISNLLPNHNYYVAVVSLDMNGLKGISEKTVSTLA